MLKVAALRIWGNTQGQRGTAVKHVRTGFLILVCSVVQRVFGSHTIGTLISGEFIMSC